MRSKRQKDQMKYLVYALALKKKILISLKSYDNNF